MPKNKHPWFKSRGYIHFDSPVGFKTAQKLVTSPFRVSRHAFYPLINYEIASLKVFANEEGELENKYKNREIKYAAHLDSHIYSYYAWQLSILYEKEIEKRGLDKNVLAFRALRKSNIEFANEAFEEINIRGRCSVIGLDVKGFFDNLNHAVLKNSWMKLIEKNNLPDDHFNVFRSLTKYTDVERNRLFHKLGISKKNPKHGRYRLCGPKEFRDLVRANGLLNKNDNEIGIPQGTPISALLSNIYMLEFDTKAKEVLEELGGSYYRYCDDMLFITKREFKDDIEKFACDEIKKLKLTINTNKTERRRFWRYGGVQKCDKPLQYLGFTFDGQRKLIRSAALARFSGRMKTGVKLAKQTVDRINSELILKGEPLESLRKKKLYERYSHLGRRNFLTYGYRAARIMKSKAIKKQLKPYWKRLQEEME